VVALWPVRAAANFTKIDDVADEIEDLALDGFEKIEKGRGLEIAHSEVDIGNEDCAVVQLRVRCAQFSPPVAMHFMRREGPDSCYRRMTVVVGGLASAGACASGH